MSPLYGNYPCGHPDLKIKIKKKQTKNYQNNSVYFSRVDLSNDFLSLKSKNISQF